MIRLISWIHNLKNNIKNEIYKTWFDIGEEAIDDIKLSIIYLILN